MLCHFKNNKEKALCERHIRNVRLNKGVIMYVAYFGPNKNSNVLVQKVTDDEIIDIHEWENKPSGGPYGMFTASVRRLVNEILKCEIKIDGVLYYGHGSSYIFSGWTSRIFLTLMDFNRLILEPLQPRIAIFDNCYTGLIASLTDLATVKSVQWVLASPHFHPTYSVLDTKTFGQIDNRHATKAVLGEQMQAISCDFQTFGPKYSCLLLIDLKKIPKLVDIIVKKGAAAFRFTRESQLFYLNKGVHDIYLATQDQQIKAAVKDVVKHTCQARECTRHVNGPSMETVMPDKYKDVFKRTLWYKLTKDIFY